MSPQRTAPSFVSGKNKISSLKGKIMKILSALTVLILLAGVSLSVGCDDKSGTIGDKLDTAIDKGSEKVKDAKEKGKNALKNAGRNMDKAIDKGSEKLEDLKKKGGKALKSMGEALE